MDKLTKTKLYNLSLFLKENNIVYSEIDITESTTKVFLNNKIFLYSRSSWYDAFFDFNLNEKTLLLVIELIREVNKALDLSKSSMDMDKMKLNRLLVNVDKSFTDKTFKVLFKNSKTFGGYTKSRREICLYDPKKESISDYLNIVPGINYHEMGHVFFTPSWKRLTNQFKKKYLSFDVNSSAYSESEIENIIGGIMQVANMFEDPRIENLMCKKISGCTEYFRKTVIDFLLSSIIEKVSAGEKVTELDCVLIAGRKYIDGKIRRWIFQEYLKDDSHTTDNAVRVNSYINKFITLSWRHDREEMMELVIGFFLEFLKDDFEKEMKNQQQFSDLIKELLKNMHTDENSIDEQDTDDNLSEDEQELLKKILKDLAKDGIEVKGSKGKSKDNPEKKGESKKSDDKGNMCHELRPENNGDNDDSISGEEVKEMMKETLRRDMDEINLRSDDLRHKVKHTLVLSPDNMRYREHLVDLEMKKDEKKLEKYFKELKTYCRNGYQTRRRSGSVDIGEARRSEWKKGVKIFRQYKRNIDKALDIDVAFVLDCSYSMAGGHYGISKIHEASKQLWIASEACRSVGAKVKVFTFSDGDLGPLPIPKSSLSYNVPKYISGTQISESLYYAENYLTCSDANTKWLISLTDGAITDISLHNSIIERMKLDGVTCGKINLTTNSWDDVYNPNDSQNDIYDKSMYMVHDGNSKENIVSFFKNIYDISLKKAISQHR